MNIVPVLFQVSQQISSNKKQCALEYIRVRCDVITCAIYHKFQGPSLQPMHCCCSLAIICMTPLCMVVANGPLSFMASLVLVCNYVATLQKVLVDLLRVHFDTEKPSKRCYNSAHGLIHECFGQGGT